MEYRIRYVYNGMEHVVYYHATSFGEIMEQARYIYTKLDKCPVFIQVGNEIELPL